MPADPLAEQAWWERVDRAVKRKGNAGSKIRSDWASEMMSVQAPDASGFGWELVDARGRRIFQVEPGYRRVPIRPEQHTDEYKAAEMRRLCDQLGRDLGVGQMP